MKKNSSIKNAVEKKLKALLRKDSTPSKEEMQVLNAAIKFLAVQIKMDEDEWGSQFDKLGEGDDEEDESNDDSEDSDGGIGGSGFHSD